MFNRERLLRLKATAKTHASHVLHDDGVMTPIIGVWRDDEPYCWVTPPNPNSEAGDEYARDPIVRAAYLCIMGMEPDAITMVQDTYTATQTTKTDGTSWEAGEMQYAREHDTVDAKFVKDSVFVMAVDRTGDAVAAHMPYEIVEVDGERNLVWLTDQEKLLIEGEEEGVHLGGYVVDKMRDAFRRQTLTEQMRSEMLLGEQVADLAMVADAAMGPTGKRTYNARELAALDEYRRDNPAEAYAHQVCAVLKTWLVPMGCTVMLGTSDPEAARVFQRSLAGLAQMFGPEIPDE